MILKICGITNQDDATAAIDAGATAVGFNFYRRSPRYLAPEEAAEIVTAAGVRRVGVFVNETRERVEEIARTARLDVAQLHGDETPTDYPAVAPDMAQDAAPGKLEHAPHAQASVAGPGKFALEAVTYREKSALSMQTAAAALAVWKAVRVDAHFDLALYRDNPAEALLLDGPAGELYGGAGKLFDWRRVHGTDRETDRKIVLAGGLDASNVAMAIELVRPWGVDACSRIESAPGRKDRKKMTEFLQAAMTAVQA